MADDQIRVYQETEIAAKLSEEGLSSWYYEDGWIRRKYTTENWPTTLMLVNTVGYLCEAAWHHADLAVTYAKVWVKLRTHSAGGVTNKDFALAKQIEGVILWRPPPTGSLEGNPNKWVKG